MSSQHQIRKALLKLSNVADFLRRHPGVAERTVYRQRGDKPPRMRAAVAADIEAALIQEGLLRGNRQATTRQQRTNRRSRTLA